MKMKKAIIRTLIVMMVAVLGLGSVIPSLAATAEDKELLLSYFRYVNGAYTNGYALNTVGNEGESHHPIFQIMSSTNGTNYYCLNAREGESWRTGTIGTSSTYNRGYDLNSSSDIDLLKNDTNEIYSDIGNSIHLNQILWILENMYIPNGTADNNLSKKRELLAKAGMVFGAVDNYDINDNQVGEGYKYIAQPDYDYLDTVSNQGKKGYFYYDTSDVYNQVEMSDELVEVAQQAALWYFTNYLENNSANSQTYNVREQGLQLACSNGTTNTNPNTWPVLEGDTFNVDTNVENHQAALGAWQQEMATVLCWYLIDAANNYATSGETATGKPLTIAPATAELAEKTVSGTDYYVVGPITINEARTAVYSLNNTITINGSTSTGAYISDANGNQKSNQTISNYIGQNFYVAVPKSKVTGSNIQISFDGTYKTNDKKLLVSTTKTEQPVVEVTPKDEPLVLEVTAPISKEFDLALRKVITAINGNPNLITNEKTTSNLATRNVTADPSTIASNGTATYKHRKDPVVVAKGDIITYSITIYNEGEMSGYATTIVDKLPNGLALKGYTENGTTTGRDSTGNYSYVYNPTDNTITITNVRKNILAPYTQTLAEETLQIECEVTQEPSSTTNTYLTNIAYITGAHNTETDQDVVQDRDSDTRQNPMNSMNPAPQLNTTGEQYTGYHGGDNHNHDNDKDVYSGIDEDYFQGREDDDDFEIVVVRPAVFDLALQKYISSVISPDGTTKQGRNAPTINTEKLANKTDTTATYTYSKDKEEPIKVKSGDYVLYTFTVYNEGELEGYVNKITDNIPTGLQFVYVQDGTVWACDSQGEANEIEVSSSIYQSILEHNGFWNIDSGSGTETFKKDTYNGEQTVSVTCDVTKYSEETYKLLKPYDSSKDNNFDGTGLDRTSVTLLLRVNGQDGTGATIRNEAAITEAEDKDGNLQDEEDLKDRDSQTDQWKGKDGDKDYQDDEDYDNIILGKVDLALTKFITAISDDVTIDDGEYLTPNHNKGSKTNPYDRATRVDTTPLRNGSSTNADYDLVKDPYPVPENSYILYNIRVYNEGNVDVYAGEVKDYLPEYLTFVGSAPTNIQYGWTERVIGNKKILTTNYLSKENNADKILKAFDKDTPGSELDYQDLPVLCRINSNAPDKTNVINSAEITKYEDENGNNIEKDIDSTPSNLDETKKNKEGRPEGRYDEVEDDEDYEVVNVKRKKVDLALTKFITAISDDENITNGEYLTPNHNEGSKTNPYDRATRVDTTPLRNGSSTNANYELLKDPLPVPENSHVLYNIRVYNEGDVDVYAGEVKDYLPNYLDFVPGEFNTKYGWEVSSDKRTVTTNYLSSENGTDKILKAFDKEKEGSELDYKDLPILCKINSNAPDKTDLINSAEITKYEDKYGNNIEKDIDSTPSNLDESKKNEIGKPSGRYDDEEDDEDYAVVRVEKKKVDLALRKFIAAIGSEAEIKDGDYLTADGNKGSKENPYTRAPKVDTTPLKNGDHDASYTPDKTPRTIPAKSYVLYTIRVYNEGETDVYAGEVTDYLPEYLDYVDCKTNRDFKWKVESDGKGKTISTTYLSHENGEENLLKAFDKKKEGSELDYKDLQIVCVVNDKAPSNERLVNSAEITKYEDKDGKEIDKDVDSEPENLKEKNTEHNEQDDDDYETVIIKTFDLSLLKYVSEVYVTEDGKTTTTQTGNTGDNNTDSIPKVEVNKKKLSSTVVKFGYTIKITNEGDIEGYAKEITDYVPEGLKFYAEDNNGWKDEGNNVISTRLLENTLLKPGESAEVKVIFRWINGSNNLGLKTNIAEISEDYNKEGVPDRDSTPDNRKEGEDDIDDAKVLLSIKTGLIHNFVMYTTVGLIILVVMGAGITAIKKYVL